MEILTQEAFQNLLRDQGISFTEKDGITIVGGGNVDKSINLSLLTALPEGIRFKNKGHVDLRSLKKLPKNVSFNNGGGVFLGGLTHLPEGVTFKNKGDVYLQSLKILPIGTAFENDGCVLLSSLKLLPEGFVFNNKGYVNLSSLRRLPERVVFNNRGMVDLSNLESVPASTQFNNGFGVMFTRLEEGEKIGFDSESFGIISEHHIPKIVYGDKLGYRLSLGYLIGTETEIIDLIRKHIGTTWEANEYVSEVREAFAKARIKRDTVIHGAHG